MSEKQVTSSILLHYRSGTSNKEYLAQVLVSEDDPSDRELVVLYGPAGRLSSVKSYGAYTWWAMQRLLSSKLAKGYEVRLVNGKPFPSGSLSDAMELMVDGKNWQDISTAQPPQRVRPVDVRVTFDVGQFAPIW